MLGVILFVQSEAMIKALTARYNLHLSLYNLCSLALLRALVAVSFTTSPQCREGSCACTEPTKVSRETKGERSGHAERVAR